MQDPGGKSVMSVATGWHIPRPSLSGSAAGSATGDPRSRGGSSSSQGSSSNHSTQSVWSGSMLLSAAQLARVQTDNTPAKTAIIAEESTYGANLTTYVGNQHQKLHRTDAAPTTDPFWSGVKRGGDPEAASVASSTHFTVVNGFTRPRPGKAEPAWCCNSSHQVTVLIITMTLLFSAAIVAAICFVEMRTHRNSAHRFS